MADDNWAATKLFGTPQSQGSSGGGLKLGGGGGLAVPASFGSFKPGILAASGTSVSNGRSAGSTPPPAAFGGEKTVKFNLPTGGMGSIAPPPSSAFGGLSTRPASLLAPSSAFGSGASLATSGSSSAAANAQPLVAPSSDWSFASRVASMKKASGLLEPPKSAFGGGRDDHAADGNDDDEGQGDEHKEHDEDPAEAERKQKESVEQHHRSIQDEQFVALSKQLLSQASSRELLDPELVPIVLVSETLNMSSSDSQEARLKQYQQEYSRVNDVLQDHIDRHYGSFNDSIGYYSQLILRVSDAKEAVTKAKKRVLESATLLNTQGRELFQMQQRATQSVLISRLVRRIKQQQFVEEEVEKALDEGDYVYAMERLQECQTSLATPEFHGIKALIAAKSYCDQTLLRLPDRILASLGELIFSGTFTSASAAEAQAQEDAENKATRDTAEAPSDPPVAASSTLTIEQRIQACASALESLHATDRLHESFTRDFPKLLDAALVTVTRNAMKRLLEYAETGKRESTLSNPTTSSSSRINNPQDQSGGGNKNKTTTTTAASSSASSSVPLLRLPGASMDQQLALEASVRQSHFTKALLNEIFSQIRVIVARLAVLLDAIAQNELPFLASFREGLSLHQHQQATTTGAVMIADAIRFLREQQEQNSNAQKGKGAAAGKAVAASGSPLPDERWQLEAALPTELAKRILFDVSSRVRQEMGELSSEHHAASRLLFATGSGGLAGGDSAEILSRWVPNHGNKMIVHYEELLKGLDHELEKTENEFRSTLLSALKAKQRHGKNAAAAAKPISFVPQRATDDDEHSSSDGDATTGKLEAAASPSTAAKPKSAEEEEEELEDQIDDVMEKLGIACHQALTQTTQTIAADAMEEFLHHWNLAQLLSSANSAVLTVLRVVCDAQKVTGNPKGVQPQDRQRGDRPPTGPSSASSASNFVAPVVTSTFTRYRFDTLDALLSGYTKRTVSSMIQNPTYHAPRLMEDCTTISCVSLSAAATQAATQVGGSGTAVALIVERAQAERRDQQMVSALQPLKRLCVLSFFNIPLAFSLALEYIASIEAMASLPSSSYLAATGAASAASPALPALLQQKLKPSAATALASQQLGSGGSPTTISSTALFLDSLAQIVIGHYITPVHLIYASAIYSEIQRVIQYAEVTPPDQRSKIPLETVIPTSLDAASSMSNGSSASMNLIGGGSIPPILSLAQHVGNATMALFAPVKWFVEGTANKRSSSAAVGSGMVASRSFAALLRGGESGDLAVSISAVITAAVGASAQLLDTLSDFLRRHLDVLSFNTFANATISPLIDGALRMESHRDWDTLVEMMVLVAERPQDIIVAKRPTTCIERSIVEAYVKQHVQGSAALPTPQRGGSVPVGNVAAATASKVTPARDLPQPTTPARPSGKGSSSPAPNAPIPQREDLARRIANHSTIAHIALVGRSMRWIADVFADSALTLTARFQEIIQSGAAAASGKATPSSSSGNTLATAQTMIEESANRSHVVGSAALAILAADLAAICLHHLPELRDTSFHLAACSRTPNSFIVEFGSSMSEEFAVVARHLTGPLQRWVAAQASRPAAEMLLLEVSHLRDKRITPCGAEQLTTNALAVQHRLSTLVASDEYLARVVCHCMKRPIEYFSMLKRDDTNRRHIARDIVARRMDLRYSTLELENLIQLVMRVEERTSGFSSATPQRTPSGGGGQSVDNSLLLEQLHLFHSELEKVRSSIGASPGYASPQANNIEGWNDSPARDAQQRTVKELVALFESLKGTSEEGRKPPAKAIASPAAKAPPQPTAVTSNAPAAQAQAQPQPVTATNAPSNGRLHHHAHSGDEDPKHPPDTHHNKKDPMKAASSSAKADAHEEGDEEEEEEYEEGDEEWEEYEEWEEEEEEEEDVK